MSKKNKQKFFIVAGELSGDYHGAKIMHYIKASSPDSSFQGIGGSKMQAEGLISLAPITKLAVMGFWEVLKKIVFFINLEKKILQAIQKNQPDKIILIDYPGMNLRLSKKIKAKYNIPILYYVSPQLWAWKENRIKIIQKYIDKLIVLFPFEVAWYQRYNMQVQYFGHPLIYESQKYNNKAALKSDAYNIAICPGSRETEINQHLPILKKVIAQKDKLLNQSVVFHIIQAPGVNSNQFQTLISQFNNVHICKKPLLSALQPMDLAIIASGTATLECAATKTPMIVIYKMSALSWFITKRFVKTSFASIVNIIAKKKLFPELLQKDLTAKNIIKHTNEIMASKNYSFIASELEELLASLDEGNSHQKTANYILNYEK